MDIGLDLHPMDIAKNSHVSCDISSRPSCFFLFFLFYHPLSMICTHILGSQNMGTHNFGTTLPTSWDIVPLSG
jgi:hypothetical protein